MTPGQVLSVTKWIITFVLLIWGLHTLASVRESLKGILRELRRMNERKEKSGGTQGET